MWNWIKNNKAQTAAWLLAAGFAITMCIKCNQKNEAKDSFRTATEQLKASRDSLKNCAGDTTLLIKRIANLNRNLTDCRASNSVAYDSIDNLNARLTVADSLLKVCEGKRSGRSSNRQSSNGSDCGCDNKKNNGNTNTNTHTNSKPCGDTYFNNFESGSVAAFPGSTVNVYNGQSNSADTTKVKPVAGQPTVTKRYKAYVYGDIFQNSK